MAMLTKCLPVVVAPHQVMVTTVRNDVVNDRCGHELAPCQTLHAQRMLPQVRLADTLPLAAVATLSGRRSVRVQGLVFVAVRTLGQSRTAGMLTRFQCFPRHRRHLLRACRVKSKHGIPLTLKQYPDSGSGITKAAVEIHGGSYIIFYYIFYHTSA